jgi:hypothetical protein
VCKNKGGHFPPALVRAVFEVFRGYVTLALVPGAGRGLVAAAPIPTGTEFRDTQALALFLDDLVTLEALGAGRLSVDPALLHGTHPSALTVDQVRAYTSNHDLERALALNLVNVVQTSAWHRGAPVFRDFVGEVTADPGAEESLSAQASTLLNAIAIRGDAGTGPRDGSPALRPTTRLEQLAFRFMGDEPGLGRRPCPAAEAIAALPPGVWNNIMKGHACAAANGFSLSRHTPRQTALSVPFSLMNHACGAGANIVINNCRLPMVPAATGSHSTVTLACVVVAWPPGGPPVWRSGRGEPAPSPAPAILAGQPLLTTYRAPGEDAATHAKSLGEYGIKCGCGPRELAAYDNLAEVNHHFMVGWAHAHPIAMRNMLHAEKYFEARARALRDNALAFAVASDPSALAFPRLAPTEVVRQYDALKNDALKTAAASGRELSPKDAQRLKTLESLVDNMNALKELVALGGARSAGHAPSGAGAGAAAGAGAGAGTSTSTPSDDLMLRVANF